LCLPSHNVWVTATLSPPTFAFRGAESGNMEEAGTDADTDSATSETTAAADRILQQQGTWLVVVKGQCGGGATQIDRFLPQWHDHDDPDRDRVVVVENPYPLFSDLGQWACMSRLHEVMVALHKDSAVNAIVVHASSQGTGTIMNYLGAFPGTTTKVRFIILEGVLASSNLTIRNTLAISNVPVLPYVLPFLGPCYGMLGYWPGGPQAITSIEKWPPHLRETPILILNAEHDRDTPALGARTLYVLLRRAGFHHVYLVIVPGVGHVDLISCPSERPHAPGHVSGSPQPAPDSPLAILHRLLHRYGIEHCPEYVPDLLDDSEADSDTGRRAVLELDPGPGHMEEDAQPRITPADHAEADHLLTMEHRIEFVALVLALSPFILWFLTAEIFLTGTFFLILFSAWMWMHLLFFVLHFVFRTLLVASEFVSRDWILVAFLVGLACWWFPGLGRLAASVPALFSPRQLLSPYQTGPTPTF
jgi:pimeloyl-ACP methyl ester carboxylesterase